MKEGGEYQDFQPKIFCLTLPKTFVWEPFIVSLNQRFETIYGSERFVKVFRRKIFVSRCQKKS